MSVRTQIDFVKTVPAGETISYDRTYTTWRPTVVATLTVGYGDGYKRALSGKGAVLIRGRRAPILGRVCMDQTMVDVTEIPGVTSGTRLFFGQHGLGKDRRGRNGRMGQHHKL